MPNELVDGHLHFVEPFAQGIVGGAVLTLEVVGRALDGREHSFPELLGSSDLGAGAVVVVPREVLPLLGCSGAGKKGEGRGAWLRRVAMIADCKHSRNSLYQSHIFSIFVYRKYYGDGKFQ